MSINSKTGFDTLLAEDWFMSGQPILNAVKNRPTFKLALGKPKFTTAKGMPNVEFSNMRDIDLAKKTTNVVTQFGATFGRDVTRGSAMLAAAAPTNPNLIDTLQFTNAFYTMRGIFTLDQMVEGKGDPWIPGLAYEQHFINAMTVDYVNQTSINMFATGPNKFAADGQFGSLRAYISDGLTTGTRAGGSGTDESNYQTYAGYSRLADDTFRAVYLEANGAVFTEDLGDTVSAQMIYNGAEHVVCPMSIARFNAFKQRVRIVYPAQLTNQVHPDLEYALGGTETITCGQVTYYLEPTLGASTWLLFIDTASLAAGSTYKNTKFEMDRMTDREAAWDIFGYLKHQLYVIAPNRCGIIEELALL